MRAFAIDLLWNLLACSAVLVVGFACAAPAVLAVATFGNNAVGISAGLAIIALEVAVYVTLMSRHQQRSASRRKAKKGAR